MRTGAHLEPLSFQPLPLGHIRPLGWLKRQLRIQADGLSGHLHEFWPKIRDSEWIGGDYRLGWESVAIWLDGVVPLAFLLDDESLKRVVARYITYILDHQQEDGWFGPWQANVSFPDHDPWLHYPLLKALIQYQEVTGDERVTLFLPMSTRIERRFRNSVSIVRGPLVYALKIEEEWRRINEDEPGKDLPHGDWEVYPTSPWNYALQLDPDDPEGAIRFETRGVGDHPFSPEGAPVRAATEGKRLPSWRVEHNAAGTLPESPVESSQAVEELALIPYGCTNLRISEFPLLR